MANGPPKMWKFGLEPRDFTYGLKKPMGNYESYGNDAVKPYGNMCDIFRKMILVAFFWATILRNPMVLQWQHLSLWIPQG